MAVGSSSPDNAKAELYDFGTGDWTTVQDYWFGGATYIAYYDMVYVPSTSAYYLVGGHDDTVKQSLLERIAMFQNGAWSEAGQMHHARQVSFCYLL